MDWLSCPKVEYIQSNFIQVESSMLLNETIRIKVDFYWAVSSKWKMKLSMKICKEKLSMPRGSRWSKKEKSSVEVANGGKGMGGGWWVVGGGGGVAKSKTVSSLALMAN